MGLLTICSPPHIFYVPHQRREHYRQVRYTLRLHSRLIEVLCRASHWKYQLTSFLSSLVTEPGLGGREPCESVLTIVKCGYSSPDVPVENVSESCLWHWVGMPWDGDAAQTQSHLEVEISLEWTRRPSDSMVLATVLGVVRWCDVPSKYFSDLWCGQPETSVEQSVVWP